MTVQTIPMGPMGANCYLVKTEATAFVVDPSAYDLRLKDFFEQNCGSERLILLTHCHFDHILGADRLRSLTGAKIAVHKQDASGLYDPSLSLSAQFGFLQPSFSADLLLNDGDRLGGSAEISVLHTPGHTAGSVCYLAGDALFTGDTLFEGSIGRTDFPTGDYNSIKDSLKRLKELSESDYKIYPGHGGETSLLRELRTNPYM